MSPPVSCLIFTLNESANLPACLESLAWCDDVVVVDSYSTDDTKAITAEHGARFVQHEFTGFGDQRNWALENISIHHPWVLILDADERVPPELAAEFAQRLPCVSPQVGAFRLRRRFHMWGKWLRYSSLYPTWVVRLIRLGRVRYINRGHAETQDVEGTIESLEHDLIDENHKGLDEWWRRQIVYARRDAEYEVAQPRPAWTDLFSSDPLRRRAALKGWSRDLPGRSMWFFLYCYLLRRGFLDGKAGYRFCSMKAMYVAMVNLYKHDLRQAHGQRRSDSGSNPLPEATPSPELSQQAAVDEGHIRV